VLALVAVLGAGIVVGAYLAYDQFLRGDSVAPLALPSASANAAAPASPASAATAPGSAAPSGQGATANSLAGTWTVAAGSVAGYRVREKLAGLPAQSDAVGRTEDVTGQVTIVESGGVHSVTAATLQVDLTRLTSDDGRRDRRLRELGIETNRFPTTRFTLTRPVAIPAEGLTGATVDVTLTGDLDLHGVTKNVTIPSRARVAGDEIEVLGSLTFPFSDFAIEPPNIAGFVTVEDEGTLEFLVSLARGWPVGAESGLQSSGFCGRLPQP